ncbi:hypothetical protein [Polymorphobacter megasporae]|uniref:hypothetical protein n=1 Tax=Glacieibacterium megasporae TaxID=2835787 RepID=UPI001C1E3697|nr:hypothetical protein [Polymorphobacter megasporae]UAJ12439.1 hypothetical protein KTC28_21775 [Polymorphobacter megasporae]
MAKGFDPYEITGIIIPGTVLTLLLAAEASPFRSMLGSDGLTVGDLGLFVLIAFVFGHLVQALGNLIELAIWPRCGLPTNLVLEESQSLVSPAQRGALQAGVTAMEGEPANITGLNRDVWRAITTRAYARVRTAGRSMRIDIANRTYGLCRGLVAALTIALLWCIYAHRDQPGLLAALALMIVAAVWRMRRAGIHYARALFLEFIDLDP